MVQIHPREAVLGGHLYGREVFQPKLALAQLIVLLSAFYLFASILLLIFSFFSTSKFSVSTLFDAAAYTYNSNSGRLLCLTVLLSGILIAFITPFTIERSKKCLDFISSCHAFHFLLCFLSHGFPFTWAWWLTVIVSIVVTTVLAEYVCSKREMQDIIISQRPIFS